MPKFPKTVESLIAALSTFPGVGPKTAERYAFALLKRRKEERLHLAHTIVALNDTITMCALCRNFTENDPCSICSDEKRDKNILCIVATEQDLIAIEHTGEYNGLYHILGGTLSPADGITPNELTIKELSDRIQKSPPKEIILAFDATPSGETTTLYLSRMLGGRDSSVTRLARGLPLGSEVHYADTITLSDAIRGRRVASDKSKEKA